MCTIKAPKVYFLVFVIIFHEKDQIASWVLVILFLPSRENPLNEVETVEEYMQTGKR